MRGKLNYRRHEVKRTKDIQRNANPINSEKDNYTEVQYK